MAIRQVQSRFTVGELDPLLWGRSDTEFYYSGAGVMTNVIVLPEGGFKRRPGLLYVDRLHRQLTREASPTITTPNGGTGANANDDDETTYLTTTTNISTVDPYIIVHYDLGSLKDIACIDVVDASLTSASNATEFFVQVSTDDAVWVTVGSAIDMSTTEVTKRVRVRGNYRYMRFVRIGSTDLGTDKVALSEFSVWVEGSSTSVAKRIDFKFNIDQTYVIFLTDKNITVYRNGTFQTDVRAPSYLVADIPTVYSTQSADTAILFQENVEPHVLVRFDDTSWTFSPADLQNISKYNFIPAVTQPAQTLTPSAISGRITLTAGGAVFAVGSVGQYVEGNGGRARIITYTSATIVEAITEIPFYSTTAMGSATWDFEQGWEDSWSATKGWPRSATFFQQRLWIGGSLSRPITLWASRIGEFFDFDIGALRDSDALEYNLDDDEPIVSLMANRSLQIFTTGGEASNLQSRLTPVTPTNPSVMSQTKVGSEPGLKPIVVDGATLFVKKGGHSIGKFLFSEAEQSYDVTNISLLSSHLIKSPVDITVRKVTNDEEASYLLIVNDVGTLTFGCMLEEQNVKGFTKATTDGLFKNVATDNTVMYAVVERTINSVTNNYLEKFDFDTYTDSAVQYFTGLPTDTFTGLDHLEGEESRALADDSVLDNVTVSGGSVTISRDAAAFAEIGLNFSTSFQSLPYENPELIGPALDRKKQLVEVFVRVYETSGMRVNGVQVDFFGLQESINPLDNVTPLFSGVVQIPGIQTDNPDYNAYITITQDDPLPLTVLSIGSKVTVT